MGIIKDKRFPQKETEVDQMAEELHLAQKEVLKRAQEGSFGEMLQKSPSFEKNKEQESAADEGESEVLKEGQTGSKAGKASEQEMKKSREEFENIKREFDEIETKIAEARNKVRGRLKIIAEALGIVKRSEKDEEIKYFLKELEELRPKLMAAGRKTLVGNEEEYKAFEIEYHEAMVAIRLRLKEDEIRAREAGFGKFFIGLANVSKNYREFISRQFLKDGKLTVKSFAKGMAIAGAAGFTAVSLLASALPALGIVAAGSAGAVSGLAFRGFTSLGAGYSLKKRLEKSFIEKKQKEILADVSKLIEAKKQKTDEEWKKFIEEKEGGKTIAEEEQLFVDADTKHKRLALGLGAGTFLLGTAISHYSADIRNLIGQAWERVFGGSLAGGGGVGIGSETPSVKAHGGGPPMVEGGAKGTVTVPEGTGRGTLSVDERYGAGKYGPEGYGTEAEGHIPEEFRGVSKVIDSGGNIWKATRDAYIENPEKYGYDSNSPKLKNLFRSLKEQGYLRRLGIRANSFGDLSDSEKIKIWAENRTANSVQKLAEAQGGRVRDLVHPGDTIFLKPDGTIVFENTSGIKAGYLFDVQRPRGFGGGYEPQGKGGESSIDTSEFDRKIAEARARGEAADARLAQIRGPIAVELAAEDARLQEVDISRAQELMDYIQGKIYGEGTGIDWKGPAREFRKRMLEKFIVSDQPMGPPSDFFEKRQYWQAVQEVVKKLGPPVGNESTQDWLARAVTEKKVSPEDIIQTLNRVVNE